MDDWWKPKIDNTIGVLKVYTWIPENSNESKQICCGTIAETVHVYVYVFANSENNKWKIHVGMGKVYKMKHKQEQRVARAPAKFMPLLYTADKINIFNHG